MAITAKQLLKIAPGCPDVDAWVAAFNDILPKYGVDTPVRQSAFLAQCAHESMQFQRISENLNYSADGLRKTFGKYFSTTELAQAYARKPERIANRVYANRMGNGDEASGDGWAYHGRGAIQLTGKETYQRFANDTQRSMADTVSYLNTVTGAVESAAWFWKTNGLNRYADTKNIVALTKKINGGTNGLDDRIAYYDKALSVLV